MVAGLDYTFNIKSVTPITGGFRLETCDTLNLRPGKIVNIGGTDYEIADFSINEYIDVVGTTNITAASFQVDPLTFEWGTLLDTNYERKVEDEHRAVQVPFLWVRTPLNYTKGSFEDIFDKTAECTIYLMDEVLNIGESMDAASPAWVTKIHEQWIIEPLINLFEKRIEKYIEENQNIFGELPAYDVRCLVLPGTEDAQGFKSTLFDEKLSGIEVRITLDFFLNENCKC